MRALAAVFLIAFLLLLTILGVGSLSCGEPTKSAGQTQQTEITATKDCATPSGVFAAGLRDSGGFIRAYHQETIAVGIVIIAIFTVILGMFTMHLAGSTRVAAAAALLN